MGGTGGTAALPVQENMGAAPTAFHLPLTPGFGQQAFALPMGIGHGVREYRWST